MGEGGNAGPGTPRWLLLATGLVGLVAAIFVAATKYYEFQKAQAEVRSIKPEEPEKKPSPPVTDRKPDPPTPTAETVVPLREAGKAEVLSGTYNTSGFENGSPFTATGLKQPFSLHPPARGKGAVRFTLDQRYQSFRSTVAIGDSGPKRSTTPITFVVLVDGEV